MLDWPGRRVTAIRHRGDPPLGSVLSGGGGRRAAAAAAAIAAAAAMARRRYLCMHAATPQKAAQLLVAL